MAIDPIGGSPELDAPVDPQAPTGFGGPTPPQTDPQYGSPLGEPSIRQSTPTRTYETPEGFVPPTPDIIGPDTGVWREEDEVLFTSILTATAPGLTQQEIADKMTYMQAEFGPEVMAESGLEFVEALGKDPAMVIDEVTVRTLTGVVSDSRAFGLAVNEEYDSTVGSAWAASYLIKNSKEEKTYYDISTFDDRLRREELAAEVEAATREVWGDRFGGVDYTGRVGAWGAVNPNLTNQAEIRGDQLGLLTDISDKGGMWLQDGNNLVLRFYDEASTGGEDGVSFGKVVADVLVRLRPGTVIETTNDAIAAWVLAETGVDHLVDPSSQDVPGRQKIVGAIIEGADNVIQRVERAGGSFPLAMTDETRASLDDLMSTDRNHPTPEGQDADIAALREQYNMAMSDDQRTAAGIVAIARMSTVDLDAPARDTIDKAMATHASFTPAQLATIDADSFEAFVDSDKIKREEMSRLGRVIQEDVFDPMLTFISAWEASLQAIAISTARVITELGDPEATGFEDFIEDARTNGVQLALDAFWQESKDYGTTADYFGIDPDSGWHMTTNVVASLAFDPLTYLTAGGVSSTKAARRMVVTKDGVEAWLKTPGVGSAARQIVFKNNPAQIGLLSGQGMSPAGIGRLLDIMEATYKGLPAQTRAMGEVLDVMRSETLAYGGLMIPASGTAVTSRKAALGMGSFFASLSREGVPGTRAWNYAADLLARSSRARSAPIGERNWLSPLINDAVVWFGKDTDEFVKIVRRAVDIDRLSRSGDEAIPMLKNQVEQARTMLSEITGGMGPEVRQVPKLQQWVKEWDDVVRGIDDQIRGLADDSPHRTAMEAQRTKATAARQEIQALVDQTSDAYGSTIAARNQQERILKRLEAQMSNFGAGTGDRGLVEEFIHQFYDEVAESIVDKNGKSRIPILEDAVGNELRHPVFDVPLRDWSVVTGRSGAGRRVTQAGNLENIDEAAEALIREGVDDFPLAGSENLHAVGVQTVAGHTQLPASIHELIAFNHSSDALWKFWHNPEGVTKNIPGTQVNVANFGQGLHTTMDYMQSLWSMSVLMNLGTSVRSSFDEIIRFYEMHGLFPYQGERFAGRSSTLRLMPGVLPGGPSHSYGSKLSPEALAWSRDASNSFNPTANVGWQVVNPADKGMWVHAERWVNGTLMNDPQFKAFARAFANNSDDATRRAAFAEWWNDAGRSLSQKNVLGSGQPITSDIAYDVIDQSLDAWLHSMDNQVVARGAILNSAAAGEQVSSVAGYRKIQQFWRSLPEVPGELTQGVGGLGRIPDGGFSLLYGGPQSRRGGVFYDYYYDSAMSMYDEAYLGKIIDTDYLQAKGYSLEQAQRFIAEGEMNAVIRDIVSDTGMVLHKTLKEHAMQFASTQADNMMYTFGAVSVLGRKAARIYPFGRAQVDYMQWWWKKLTEPTIWRNPATGTTAVQAIPGNVRLADRMAKLVMLEEPNTRERSPFASPAGIVNAFSFAPTSLDQHFIMSTTAGLGNFAGWALNMPWMNEEVRSWIQELHPAHAIFSDPAENMGEWFGEQLPKALVPTGRGSVAYNANGFRQFAALIFAGGTLGLDPFDPTLPHDQQRELNSMANWLIIEGDKGPYQRDHEAYYQSQYLAEFGLTSTPSLDPESEWMRDMAKIAERATVDAIRNDVGTVADVFGVLEHPGTDLQQITPVLAFPQYVDGWFDDGHITDGKRDSLLLGYEAATAEGASRRDRQGFINEAYDTLFDIIPDEQLAQYIAENNEAAIALSSWYRVIPHLVPDEYADGIDRGRIIVTGDDGYEFRKAGYNDGWLSPRDGTEHAYNAGLVLHRAVRENMTRIYEEATGIKWGASKQPQLDDDGVQKIDRHGDPMWDYLSDSQTGVVLTADWWRENRAWLESTDYIDIPRDWIRDMMSGAGTIVSTQDFKNVFKEAKKHYTYKFTLDPTDEVNLNRIGADDRDPSRLMYGVDRAFPDPGLHVMSLAHYGSELVDDYAWAVDEMEKTYGFADPSEWGDGEYIIWKPEDQISDDMTDDQASMIVSKEIFRQRFSGAVGLNKIDPRQWQYSESDYNGSKEYDFFGPIGWEEPVLPGLHDVDASNQASVPSSSVVVEDGDTLKIDIEGSPVFFRLMGINAADKGEDGWGDAQTGLADLIESAETVTVVIYNPETYGSGTSHFTKENGIIVRRDRPLVWLYVDGVPVYDEDQFSATNIRGVGIGGTVPDYQDMRDRHVDVLRLSGGGERNG